MKSSATSHRSKNAKRARATGWLIAEYAAVFLLLGAISATAIWWHYRQGHLLYYGDAEAHLNIARRIVDSRTPGAEQIGTVWLPLPHLLMAPFVRIDALWQNGLAGSFSSGGCFVLAGLFLYGAVRRLFDSRAAAAASVLLFALNPNVLYLQSIPMTEAVLFASLMVLLYATVWFGQSGSLWAVLLAAAASNAASMTRYEGWFLIPFVALYLWIGGKRHAFWKGALFGALAAIGPAAWLAHNWWWYGDPLEFYHGEWSAKAIYQRSLDAGMERYPGDHDLPKAWIQFREAARLCAGDALAVVGLAGLAAALWKRALWVVLLLALPVVFYIWSIYSSGTPIFVPHLWPDSYYNTRYGMAAFPLLVLGAASLAALLPGRWRGMAAVLIAAVAVVPWVLYPRAENWICWKEAKVNSDARRAWTKEAGAYLKKHYRAHDGVFSSFSDLTGIYRNAGIPLREVLHEGNHPQWDATVRRPDLFLWEHWAVAISGDAVSTAIVKTRRNGPAYTCVKIIAIQGAPVIEIYRRTQSHDNSVYQSSRPEK